MGSSSFGETVRRARTRAGLTQRELAAKIGPGVHYTAISKVERGERPPSGDFLIKVASALNISIDTAAVAAGRIEAQPEAPSSRLTADERRRLVMLERRMAALPPAKRGVCLAGWEGVVGGLEG